MTEEVRRKRFVSQCFFFFGRETQKWAWKPFWPLIPVFFTGKNRFSRPLFSTFLGFFTATFCFHAHFCDFFSRVKNMVSRPKFQEFSRIFLLLTGRILDFFHVHYFSFHGRNFRKFSRAKINFHGYFLGAFSVFFTGTFFFHTQNSKFYSNLHGWLFFFTPKKKKHCVSQVQLCQVKKIQFTVEINFSEWKNHNFKCGNLTFIENAYDFFSTFYPYGSILLTEKKMFSVEKFDPNWRKKKIVIWQSWPWNVFKHFSVRVNFADWKKYYLNLELTFSTDKSYNFLQKFEVYWQ